MGFNVVRNIILQPPKKPTGGLTLSDVLPMDAVSATWTAAYGVGALTKSWRIAGKPLFDLASGETIKTVIGGYPDVMALANKFGCDPRTGIGGGAISKWYDQSGNGRDATQATSANQPYVWLVNGSVYVAFGGVLTQSQVGASSMQYLTIPSGASFNNRSQTGFAIVKPYTTSDAYSGSTDNFSTIFTGGTTQNGLAVILPMNFFNADPAMQLMDTVDFTGPTLDPPSFTTGKSVVSWQGTASARLIGLNEVSATSSAPSANTMTGGLIGAFPQSVTFGGFSGRMIGIMISSDIISAPNMATIRSAMYSYANVLSTIPTTVPATVVIDGASYNQGVGADPANQEFISTGGGYGWAEQVQDAMADQNIQWHNTALSGYSWATLSGVYSRYVGPCFNSSATKNILVSGDPYGNETGSPVTGASMYASFQTWLATAKGNGWDSILIYLLSSSDTVVQDYNALMRANAATNGITLVDMAIDARLDNTLGDNVYFKNGHPTVLGASAMRGWLEGAIRAALR